MKIGLKNISMIKIYTPVAQLDRALVSGTKSRRFESSQACHIFYKKDIEQPTLPNLRTYKS